MSNAKRVAASVTNRRDLAGFQSAAMMSLPVCDTRALGCRRRPASTNLRETDPSKGYE